MAISFPQTSQSSLASFLASLPLDRGRPLGGGGTPARSTRFEALGRSWVVKYLTGGPALVDGHDAATLARKLDQIALVRSQCPRLAPRYVEPVAAYRGPDGTAIVMPFYPGTSPTRLIAAGPAAFVAWYAHFLSDLIRDGYAVRRAAAPPGWFASLYARRVCRRLPVLSRWLPEPALAAELVVNGELCRGPRRLMAAIADDSELGRSLDPPHLFLPVHGDLNLGNVRLDRSKEWVLVDPRGTLEDWDIVYDVAKSVLSLLIFDHALADGVRVSLEREGKIPRWRVEPRTAAGAASRDATDAVTREIDVIPALARVLDGDDWRTRLRFGVAFHALADAACRISDDKSGWQPDARTLSARVELAVGLWLVGTLLLERLLRAREAGLAAVRAASLSW